MHPSVRNGSQEPNLTRCSPPNLTSAQSLDGGAEETFGGREELERVRQARVEFKCGFVVPFGMNRKH